MGAILRKVTSKIVLPQMVITMLTKLVEDMQQIPALRSLVTFVGTKIVGGTYDLETSPMSLSRRLYYNMVSYVSSLGYISNSC